MKYNDERLLHNLIFSMLMFLSSQKMKNKDFDRTISTKNETLDAFILLNVHIHRIIQTKKKNVFGRKP